MNHKYCIHSPIVFFRFFHPTGQLPVLPSSDSSHRFDATKYIAMNSQGCISPTHLTIFSSFYSRSKPHQSLRIASNWLTVFIVLYICKMCLSKKNNLFQPSDFCLSMDLSVRCCIRKQRTEMWDRKFKIDTDMKWTSFSVVSLCSELQWQRVQWHNSGWLQSLQQGLISRT